MSKSYINYEKLSEFYENKLGLIKLFQNLGYSVRVDFAYTSIGNPTDIFVEELKLGVDVDFNIDPTEMIPELIEIDEEEITKRFYYLPLNPKLITMNQISKIIRFCLENPVPDTAIDKDVGQVV